MTADPSPLGVTETPALDPNGFLYTRLGQRTAAATQPFPPPGAYRPLVHWPHEKGAIEIEGPLLPDGMHHYVATVAMVQHRDDHVKRSKSRSSYPLGVLTYLTMIPVIGWVVAAILAIPLGFLAFLLRGKKLNNPDVEAELANPTRPWVWTLSRRGPDAWRVVVVPLATAQGIGLRNPEMTPDGRYYVEQIEPTKEAAIAAATHAVNTLT
jgi:hypothetical protein